MRQCRSKLVGGFNQPHITPPKTNMEPENEALEEEIPIKNHHYLGSMLVFGGCSPNWVHLPQDSRVKIPKKMT